MTDLFQAAAAAPTRMTLAHQALANLVGAWALTVFTEHLPDLEQLIADILPAARQEVPFIAVDVVAAAELIHRAASAGLPRGHLDWFEANNHARAAMIRFLTRRGCAAMRAHLDALSPAPQKEAADAQS